METIMTEETQQLLANLRLKKMAMILDQELEHAQKNSSPYSDFLLRLLQAQWYERQEKCLQYRIHQARLPEQWTLESFPFKKQPGVSRRQIQELAALEFIPRTENIVFIGQTAVGKTGLGTGLLLKALQNGYRGLFIQAQDLLDEMYASLADRSSRKLIKRLARVDLLLIDELGYLNIRPEQTNIFFKLIEERYNRKPTIITTNLEYDQWHNIFTNKDLVNAMLSRLRHHCHTIRIEGPPLREPQG
jgi:DNA replication protein DnaC